MTTSTFVSNHEQAIDGTRTAGVAAIVAALTMLTGTGFWAASGADLDAALEHGRIGDYLGAAAADSTMLTLNLGFWIAGVVLLGVAGNLLVGLGDKDSAAASVARFAFTAVPAAAVVYFSVWLGIVLELAPAHLAGQQVEATARALAQAVSLADWIGTVVILALGGAALALSGRGSWVPRWLLVWAMVSAVAGVSTLAGLVLDMRTSLALPIVPIGLGFMIAAGITALRRAR